MTRTVTINTIKLTQDLELDRCPHCKIDRPHLRSQNRVETKNHKGGNPRCWTTYICSHCGGVVTASAPKFNETVLGVFPSSQEVDSTIPTPAKDYLTQAINSLHAPAGAVMLAASAVDAMLKAKNYKEGSLYTRIDKAAKEHVITEDMAKWAHKVRLDANEPRHADEKSPLPDETAAIEAIEFTQALAQFMFVLPARIERGLNPPAPGVNQQK